MIQLLQSPEFWAGLTGLVAAYAGGMAVAKRKRRKKK